VPVPIANVIGFDDGPFDPWGGSRDILLVGAVFARTQLDGVVSGRVRRDGRNATAVMAKLVQQSQFDEHIRAVLLRGIAVAGFNVVDIHALSAELERPVVVEVRVAEARTLGATEAQILVAGQIALTARRSAEQSADAAFAKALGDAAKTGCCEAGQDCATGGCGEAPAE
jgi:hypothetical protein